MHAPTEMRVWFYNDMGKYLYDMMITEHIEKLWRKKWQEGIHKNGTLGLPRVGLGAIFSPSFLLFSYSFKLYKLSMNDAITNYKIKLKKNPLI